MRWIAPSEKGIANDALELQIRIAHNVASLLT